MPNDNPSNLPAISPKSPLAEGATVNVRPAGDEWQLRVWIAGTPVENSLHASPSAAMARLAAVVVARMGGKEAAVGAFLGALGRMNNE